MIFGTKDAFSLLGDIDHRRYVVSSYGFKAKDKTFDNQDDANKYLHKLIRKNGIKVVNKHYYSYGKEYIGEDGRSVLVNQY